MKTMLSEAPELPSKPWDCRASDGRGVRFPCFAEGDLGSGVVTDDQTDSLNTPQVGGAELPTRSGFTLNAIKTDLLAGFTPEQVEKIRARFEAKVSPCPLTGCFHWDAAVTKEGYGVFSLAHPTNKPKGSKTRRIVFAHRLAYEFANGPIPPGMTLDHTRICKCVNPSHMEPVPNRVNTERRTLRRRLQKITFAAVVTALAAEVAA